MKENIERKNENKNQSSRIWKTIRGLEKELGWLKKEQRACHFFLFHLLTKYPPLANQGTRNAGDINLSGLSEKEYHEKTILHSDTRSNQTNHFFSDQAANMVFANSILNPYSKKMTGNSLHCIVYYLYYACHDNNQRLELISKTTSLWGECRKKYPFPFSWLNSNNKEHCQWLWDEMHKRCIGVPFLARDHIQQWHFIVAAFDNWKGWSMDQQNYLTKKNPKRNPGKLLPHSLYPDRIEPEHKAILLDELKSTWEQKERRARKAKATTVARLTKAAQKKLEFIALAEKITPKDTLNQLINNAFNAAKLKSRQS